MLLGKFKEQLLYKKLQKNIKELPEARTSSPKKIHSVGILITNEISSKIDLVEVVKAQVEDVRHVNIYSYRNYNASDEITYKHFTKRDFDWSGNIKEASLENFLETPFDLLIGYFNKKHLYLEYASVKSMATFKIGFANVNDNIFDLVIHNDIENSEEYIETAKKYLKLLGKI